MRREFVKVVGWLALGACLTLGWLYGQSLYKDWQFLHMARLGWEAQRAKQIQGGGNVKEGDAQRPAQ